MLEIYEILKPTHRQIGRILTCRQVLDPGQIISDDLHLAMREAGDRNAVRRRGLVASRMMRPRGERRFREHEETDKAETIRVHDASSEDSASPFELGLTTRGSDFRLLAASSESLQWRDRAGLSPASNLAALQLENTSNFLYVNRRRFNPHKKR